MENPFEPVETVGALFRAALATATETDVERLERQFSERIRNPSIVWPCLWHREDPHCATKECALEDAVICGYVTHSSSEQPLRMLFD